MSERRKKNILELTHCSLEQYRRMGKLPLCVMTDNVRSMYNIGSIFRTADAFLISHIILAGISGRPPHPEISKTALGAEESVAWTYAPDAVAAVEEMRREGWKILVLEQTLGSVELNEYIPDRNERYLLVVGNEVEGVDQRIVDMSEAALEIPQFGTKHSLNVSSSASIAMWHLFNHLR